MSGFKALNIESDDESDVEIDDTKELQIEDALKLYQTALKYHAEGPASFDQAAAAYEQLFESDIFKYPESQIELRRIELYGPLADTDDSWEDGAPTGPVVASSGLDTGPSTLPQILHLSHKNYAQFKLEHLTSRLETFNVTLQQILSDAVTALDHFVEALDKDDSDLDLWRRTASVGEMLDSKRAARFCLEAVLDGDDEGLGNVLAQPGLEEGLAGEQLRDLVQQLDDQLSLLQSPLSVGKRRVLSKMLKQRLNSHQEITDRERALKSERGPKAPHKPSRVTLKAPKTWAEMGELLLRQLMAEQHGTSSVDPAIAIRFDVSDVGIEAPKLLQEPEPIPRAERQGAPSSSADQQFPGQDNGQPTTQPQIAAADANMQAITGSPVNTDLTMAESAAATTTALPTRKRSNEVAGLNEGAEEGRTKSKRTRTRESTTGDDSRQAVIDANTRWEYEQQLKEFEAADDWMFETGGNLFERIGVVGFESARHVRRELSSSESDEPALTNGHSASQDTLKLAKTDIQAFLNSYSEQLAHVLMIGGESWDIAQGPGSVGFGSSMTNTSSVRMVSNRTIISNDHLDDLLQDVNNDWLLTREVAWKWLCALLRRPLHSEFNSYREHLWPENLKTMVVRTLVNFDESVLDQCLAELDTARQDADPGPSFDALAEMIETIFELHLDIYCLIKEPNSGVDEDTISAQSDRLQRWSGLVREAMHLRTLSIGDSSLKDDLGLRYLWATTFLIGAAQDVTQDHVIECMSDLRAVLVAAEEPSIQMQNNAIMPELSVAALDREVSRLTTKDFFLKVTSQDQRDPVAVIESLEPLLTALDGDVLTSTTSNGDDEEAQPSHSVSPDLVRFLESSDISVRLLLWKRLRDAYLDIDYKPMVISCFFKIMKLLLDEMRTSTSTITAQHERQVLVLKSLRLIQEMTAKTLTIIQSSKENAFECIDEHILKVAVSGFGEVLQLLQVFNVFEDSLRVGQTQPPTLPNGLAIASFSTLNSTLHDMQVHIWTILYWMLKESIFQFHDLFPNSAEDRFDFLRAVHRNLGLRGICGSSNRVFVRMLKDEFFQLTHVEGYDSEQAQVLYDLYGLNCFLNPNYELIEHHCTHDAFLDRGVALQAVDLLLQQASKLPTRDLAKHPIKDTIEKVHGAAPRKKPTDAIQRNREIYRAFLRSPINPLDLFSCLRGEGNQLGVSPIPREDAVLASKGWYFLMGHIALAKYRTQKRTSPTPTEDVDIAIAFFMQDLEFSMDNWETWFRLAQAYDTKIEESVVWSAEKLNSSMPEIVQLQRAAIHCYTMATALAYRSAGLVQETSEKMTELFHDFAVRLYASSREPFSMQPFALDDTERFLSLPQGLAKAKLFQPLRVYTAWKLAKVFFQKALADNTKAQSWTLKFALGKCLWKMHAASDQVRGPTDKPPSAEQVLATFIRAIELIPDEKKKDSREKREPVLEPHYKLVSIVHKLVSRGEIGLERAKEALEDTPYARSASFPQDMDEWVPYVLNVLKNLRAADKSNWHHRMIARAARCVYDDSDSRADANGGSGDLGAIGAKYELTQQMFTKTMVLQVWRPECERAGRHFVYTARYTRFFVRILEQLKDRSNLEMLAKRTRKRPHDVFEHALVWQDICNAYLRLLRNYGALQEGLETSTFSNIAHEDFLVRKEPLEKWMQSQDTGTSAALDVLREVQELKKINMSLMKPGPIDDLIGDAYAYLFSTIGRQLWEEERRIKQEEEAKRPPPVTSPPRNPMMSLTHLMNIDGAAEAPVPALPQATSASAAQPEAPVRRKIGVGRREIRTCAEACFQKAPVVATPKSATSYPRVQVVIDNSRLGDASVETSAPGSIHDSADDESELSELEEEGADDEDEDGEGGASVKEEEPRKPIFPGLAAAEIESEGFETAEEEHGTETADVEMREAGADEQTAHDSEVRSSGAVDGVNTDEPRQSVAL